MATYLIQDTTSKAIKKSLIKWGEFPIDNSSVRGTVTIKNYRQYQFRNEVDIEFKVKSLLEFLTKIELGTIQKL